MTQNRRKDIEANWQVVVTGDRVAHLTSGGCWADDDHLIGLADTAEAEAHGYALCPTCTGGANAEDADEE